MKRAEWPALPTCGGCGVELPLGYQICLKCSQVPASEVTTDAGPLWTQPDDRVIAPALARTGVWEPGEAQLLETLVRRRPGWFVDLGAHVGYHSCRLLARQATRKVVAVEANPRTFALLLRNLARFQSWAQGFNLAAWDRPGTLQLRHAEPGNGGDYRVGGSEGFAVDAAPMDNVVRQLPHPTVGVIKSDLQGRDHIALRGLTETLRLHRPDVVCEFDPAMIEDAPGRESPADVLEWYLDQGYVFRDVASTRLDPSEIVEWARSCPGGGTTLWLSPKERSG